MHTINTLRYAASIKLRMIIKITSHVVVENLILRVIQTQFSIAG